MYKTLIVAPETNLPMAKDEVQQVINLLGSKVLTGSDANIRGLLNILSEPFDIVWFATHGDEKGIYLNDGVVNASELTSLIRSVGASFVVLNTCSSRSVALALHDELRLPLVCTLREVPDRTAFILGTLLARQLARGLSFREAYEIAKPGQNSTYAFLPEEGKIVNERKRVEHDLESIIALVKRLEIIVSGSSDYNVEGLIPTVKELSRKVELLSQDFVIMRQNQLLNRRLLWAVIITCIILIVSVGILALWNGKLV